MIRILKTIPSLLEEFKRECIHHQIESLYPSLTSSEYFLIKENEKTKNLKWIQKDLGLFQEYSIHSIKDAVEWIRKKQSEFKVPSIHLSLAHHRRGELIASHFKDHREKTIYTFGEFPNKKFILYSLVENQKLLLSESPCELPIDGVWEFHENKTEPPSRAYLKLWEAFSRLKILPHKNEIAIDLGSCPGGWTWMLHQHCLKVISVDGALIDERLIKKKNIEFLKADAFQLNPNKFNELNWICSDMICDPEKLYSLAIQWLEAHPNANFIFTLKFKGPSDFKVIQKFQSIENSSVIHLYQNKHELTWIRMSKNSTTHSIITSSLMT